MLTIHQPLKDLLINGATRFATCWRITLTNGTVLRFTDHDTSLTLDGETYDAALPAQPSARQRQEGFAPSNMEIRGAISSDRITHSDLSAGLYHEATIEEFLIDWQVPWAGKFSTQVYYIEEVSFNGQIWTLQIAGLAIKLRPRTGIVVSRDCLNDLYDSMCGVSAAAFTHTGEVTAVTNARLIFTGDVVQAADYFLNGVLTWTSGNNDGLTSVVRSSSTAGLLNLHLETPYDIEVGDTFSIKRGCDHKFSTCVGVFGNGVNFNGEPHIVGEENLFRAPQ